ncbi:MAG: DUF3127 domain-containing protein [Bacteroidota bacterium]
MSFDVDGKLHKKYETEQKTDSFKAREFVIEIDGGQYPQFIKFQLVQDRCSLLDDVNEGETIKVHFDLRGREWQGKYFTNLNAWRIEKPQPASPGPTATTEETEGGDFPTASDDPGFAADDDLPF